MVLFHVNLSVIYLWHVIILIKNFIMALLTDSLYAGVPHPLDFVWDNSVVWGCELYDTQFSIIPGL